MEDSKFKLIPLTQEKYAIVDEEDYAELSKYKWHYNKKNKHVRLGIRKYTSKTLYMHRELLKTDSNIDHINHNTLDNRKSNLRICTQADNCKNTSSRRGKTSKFLGVHKHSQQNVWIAQIKVDGKIKHLGSFKDEEEAAKAYDKAAVEYFGEFASLNFK
jgi:hypothetical protein